MAAGCRKRGRDASNQRRMAAIGRMDADAQNLQRGSAKCCRGRERRSETKAGPACPSDHRATRKFRAGSWRPDAEMIFRDRHRAIAKCLDGALSVEPGRGDEAVNPTADNVLEQRTPFGNSSRGVFAGQTEEFTLPGCHELCAEPISRSAVLRLVAMEIAVKEDLRPAIGPGAQPFGEGRSRNDWSIAPVVGDDQHGHAIADMRAEQV